MSEVFDHPLKDKALKTYIFLPSQQYFGTELHFLSSHSTVFISNKQWWPNSQNISQSASYAQDTSSEKTYGNIPLEIQPINTDQWTELQKKFDLFKQIEEIIEPYWANISPLYDLENL